MKLIVGLGNPGELYKETLHNAGFMAVDYLAKHFGFDSFGISKKNYSDITEGEIAGEKVIIAKPQIYMNQSGQAIQSLAHFYKIPAKDIIVIFDEANIPFGKLRIRFSGSAGGHNGVQSVIDHIGKNFSRIRLGIQPQEPFLGPFEYYVLSKVKKHDRKDLESVIQKIPFIVETILKKGLEEAMQRFN